MLEVESHPTLGVSDLLKMLLLFIVNDSRVFFSLQVAVS